MFSYRDQFRQVIQGGLPVLTRKLTKVEGKSSHFSLFLLHGLWAVPVVFLMRVMKPFKTIRIGAPRVSRIGHFAADVGQRKARDLIEGCADAIDWYYLDVNANCSNHYWAKVTGRWLRLSRWAQYVSFWNRLIPFGKAHQIDLSDSSSRDVGGYLEKAHLNLPITADEEASAVLWMSQFGWKIGDPFVCLMVRDAEYLNTEFSGKNWEYHSYRDSDIKTYIKAINYLTSNDIFVFRMGKKMANPAEISNPKFIDYPFLKEKSDMLDVWLFANCNLCITTGSGPDMISDVFRRPILAVNFLPLQCLWSWSNALHHPKPLKWRSSQKVLTVDEYLTHSYQTTEEYNRHGIEIHDLTDHEIYEAVKEAWQRVSGTWVSTTKGQELHQKFIQTLTSHPDFDKYHKFIHPKSRISENFIKLITINNLIAND